MQFVKTSASGTQIKSNHSFRREKQPRNNYGGYFAIFGILLFILIGYYYSKERYQNDITFQASKTKNDDLKNELSSLKSKIRKKVELTDPEKRRFCELMWLVEKTLIQNCLLLTNQQRIQIMDIKPKFPKKARVLAQKMGIDDDDFEDFKEAFKKDELPKF